MAGLRDEVEITWVRKGGPGGQHRNKTETGVRVRHRATGLVVVATERRSRTANLRAAMERLKERLAERARRRKPRRPTRPTRSSVEQRLKAKRIRGRRKQERRDADED